MTNRAAEHAGPIRSCVGCRTKQPQGQLSRLAVLFDDGRPKVTYDLKRRLPGRGAYICADNPKCLARVIQKGLLARALRVSDPDLSILMSRS
ncbi:MAG: YlxR family protein [Deltaproteobacteria bacterium]|nr:YlxR family protein [Deltaproteobacteria bacterium]